MGQRTEERGIIGFGSAAGKNNLTGPRAQQRGDRRTGAFHRSARALSKGVDRGGIPVLLAKIRQHRREDFRVTGVVALWSK